MNEIFFSRFPPGVDKDQMNQVVMIIGSNNVFEVGSRKSFYGNLLISMMEIFLVCEALKIGDNNILECKGKDQFLFQSM